MPLAYRSSVNNVESSPTVSTFSMTPDQVPTPYRQSPPALPLSSSQQLDELSMIDLNLARGTTGSATSQTALTSHNESLAAAPVSSASTSPRSSKKAKNNV